MVARQVKTVVTLLQRAWPMAELAAQLAPIQN
jgi:hypothetical protein